MITEDLKKEILNGMESYQNDEGIFSVSGEKFSIKFEAKIEPKFGLNHIKIKNITIRHNNENYILPDITYQTEFLFGPELTEIIDFEHLALKLIRVELSESWSENALEFRLTEAGEHAKKFYGSDRLLIAPGTFHGIYMVNSCPEFITEMEDIDVKNLEEEHHRICSKYLKFIPFNIFKNMAFA
ncbi:hypothetical protein [Gluconobacter cerinus]|uniref:hypothetical protein n=1 Tax=Gluconobacter cerinus TaxID=38307 RepID=UPI001B8BD747|nr:hypothetical protein [Gluconobacter cerinus]MBS1038068.1 hypothetical protein [Gluconobacter cerinus]